MRVVLTIFVKIQQLKKRFNMDAISKITAQIQALLTELENLDLSGSEDVKRSFVIKEKLQELRHKRTILERHSRGKNSRSGASFGSDGGNIFGSVFRALAGAKDTQHDVRALVSNGSALIQDSNIVDDVVYSLQASNFLNDAGVQFVSTANNRQVPKITSYPAASWITEGNQVADTQPAIDSIKWEFKDLAVLVKVQNNVLYDSAVNTENLINQVAMNSINDAILKAILYGSGSSGQPLGLDNYQNILEVSMGTDGAAITDYTKHTQAVKKLLQANNDLSKISFVQSPDVFQQVNDLQVEIGNYQLPPFDYRNNSVFTTSAVKSDYVQGATNDTTRIYVGDFSKLIVGVGQEVSVKLVERYADYLQTAFLVHVRIDPQPLFENSFCIIKGITTT